MTRVASLVHGGGSGAGQGGFGGVFGSKNLKAIAFLGTKSIKIADPKGLKDVREWYDRTWPSGPGFGGFGGGNDVPSCCVACGQQRKCHNRNRAHSQDSDDCAESTFFSLMPEYGLDRQAITPINRKGTDIVQQLGLNAMETCFMGPMSFPTDHNPDFPIQPQVPAYTALGWYMKKMYDMGIIGPGTKYDMAPLDMNKFATQEFMEIYGIALANRYGIGDLLADGTARLADTLGRTDDFSTLCRLTMWGYQDHWSMPGVDWAYGNLMDSRDINSHDMNFGSPNRFGGGGGVPNERLIRTPTGSISAGRANRHTKPGFFQNIRLNLLRGVSITGPITRNRSDFATGVTPNFSMQATPRDTDIHPKLNRGISMPSPEEIIPSGMDWKWGAAPGI
jgi:aldehyde:ferredoxin oxidoreductase